MTNNDILRRLRYAFDFSNSQAAKLFNTDPASSADVSTKLFESLIAKEDNPAYIECSDAQLACFLDGLIVLNRGLREPPLPKIVKASDFRLARNDVLKKLRIAMNYREQEMLDTLKHGGSELTKGELGALFRNPQHKHYRACGNQVLRNFIKGLTHRLRD